VAHDLVEVTVLVSEHAAAAVLAMLLLVEDTAVFGPSLVGLLEEIKFFFSVRKLTLIAISALVGLDPILAHFGLVLGFVDLLLGLAILADLGRLLAGVVGAGGRWSEGGVDDHLQWCDIAGRDELFAVNGERVRFYLGLKWIS